MKSQQNDTITKNIKRKAKRIKKEQGLPYHLALEKVITGEGYQNWKNFTNQTTPPRPRIKITEVKKPLPKPLTIPFYWINNTMDSRPNVKGAIPDHQKLGAWLKELYFATQYNRTARTNISKVRSTLDEWIQREYPSGQELTDEVFFTIYYGDFDTTVTPWPDELRKKELLELCKKTTKLLGNIYHNCIPLKKLVYQLARAMKAINNWPINRNVKFERMDRKIQNGKIVFIKHEGKNGIVIQHDTVRDVVSGYTDKGEFHCERSAVSVLRKQPKSAFRPLRLKLPYGKWILADGSQILFNRDYCPLWLKKPDGKTLPIDHRAWVDEKKETEFYFDESKQPWDGNLATWSTCEDVLSEWKVGNRKSELMKAFELSVRNGRLAVIESNKARIKILNK